MKKLMVFGDIHVPFHSKPAQSIVLSVISEWKPDVIVLNGDLLDFYGLSPFDRDPERKCGLEDEFQLANRYLDHIDTAAPDALKIFEEGNHEDRLRKYIWRNSPALAGLGGVDTESFLKLSERGWKFVPYFNPVESTGVPGYDLNGILIMHGLFARKASAATARAHFERFHCSGIHGHTHRLGVFLFRAYGGAYTWLESGCLCGLEPSYTPSPDWQNGFVAGYIHDKPSSAQPFFEMQKYVIHNKKLSFEGRLFKA